ncbi:MAG: L-aspartate oxidase [Chloroflexi bacterium]|nr:L-aspartate oxidase [Chloroflexota bacterium]
MAYYDYIIIGSGIAGLYTALLAQAHGSVLVLTKSRIDECNTRHAQGGIAAAIGTHDSPDAHLQDTLSAGAGLVNLEAARILADEAADRIQDLVSLGVPFDTVDGEIALAREGAHTFPRVLHAGGDATGAQIELTLTRQIRASRVTVLEHHLVTEIYVEGGAARGVHVLDCLAGAQETFEGKFFVIASGGAGQLFKLTTNPLVATGDGVALAYQAGAEIADIEFYQFHPTALSLPGVPHFLISEAVRGEGAHLLNETGHRFMVGRHPLAELAPRDVVARAAVVEMREASTSHVYLDITHLPKSRIIARFPTIYTFCLEHGLDITSQPIPVAPAAHYMIGGIKTNVWGETNIAGLYACGEVARTGVHGANRLASNSLLEVVIFAKRIVRRTVEPDGAGRLTERPTGARAAHAAALDEDVSSENPALEKPCLAALQSLTWEHLGIERSQTSIAEALERIRAWRANAASPRNRAEFELANLLLVGMMIGQAANIRTESRGAHFRCDYPKESPAWVRPIVFRKRLSH